MKKRIACLLLLVFSVMGLLSGCSLFTTDYQKYLNQPVVTVGDISVSKEELLNYYYNYIDSLTSEEGYTKTEAVDYLLEKLVARKVMLKDLTAKAELEGALGAKDKTFKYQLNFNEYNDAIKSVWSFVDEQLETFAAEIKEDFDLTDEVFKTEEEKTPTYAPYSPYESKLESNPSYIDGNGNPAVKQGVFKIKEEIVWEEEEKLNYENYVQPLYNNNNVGKLVWDRYMSSLKTNEAGKNHTDKSNSAVFGRELERLYKINIENAYLTKFQENYTNNWGFDADGKINESLLQAIIDAYTKTYNANKELYNISRDTYYSEITGTSSREKFVYYGSQEVILSCMHILVKTSDDQSALFTEIDGDAYLTDEEKETAKANLLRANNLFTTERDDEGFEIENAEPLSVVELYNALEANLSSTTYNRATDSEGYAQDITERFASFMYKYGMDNGSINATYDYVVGATQTSTMVETFTEVVRKLYNNGTVVDDKYQVEADYDNDVMLTFNAGVGYEGAYSSYFLESSDSYRGYHIVLLTGIYDSSDNIDPSILTTANVYSKLNAKSTSRTSGKTLFDYFYDQAITSSTYEAYEQSVVESLTSGAHYVYYKNAYSELLVEE